MGKKKSGLSGGATYAEKTLITIARDERTEEMKPGEKINRRLICTQGRNGGKRLKSPKKEAGTGTNDARKLSKSAPPIAARKQKDKVHLQPFNH